MSVEDVGVQERRQFKRVKLSEPVQYHPKDSLNISGSLSRDISEGGLRLTTSEFIPLDTELALSIQLSAEEVIDCLGKVVWVEQLPHTERYQAGLKFEETDTSFDSKHILQKFLQSSPVSF